MGRGKSQLRKDVVRVAKAYLSAETLPTTMRHLFYVLVSSNIGCENTPARYATVLDWLNAARWSGEIPFDDAFEKVVDGLREPHKNDGWESLNQFAHVYSRVYERQRWAGQSSHVELWIEKDAVATIVQPTCARLQITLRSLRGFNSNSAIYGIAKDLLEVPKNITIFYMGDHDVHGLLIEEENRDRLQRMFNLMVCAAKMQMIDFRPRLGILPADITADNSMEVENADGGGKGGENFRARRKTFIREFGNRAAEVDALSSADIIQRVDDAVMACIDSASAWEDSITAETAEREKIATLANSSQE